ncbi:MAG: hypothetical protein Q7J47_04810 [Azoarcus sp.]|nr:hypothetical protein [Azoarcus sp.]
MQTKTRPAQTGKAKTNDTAGKVSVAHFPDPRYPADPMSREALALVTMQMTNFTEYSAACVTKDTIAADRLRALGWPITLERFAEQDVAGVGLVPVAVWRLAVGAPELNEQFRGAFIEGLERINAAAAFRLDPNSEQFKALAPVLRFITDLQTHGYRAGIWRAMPTGEAFENAVAIVRASEGADDAARKAGQAIRGHSQIFPGWN